LKFFSSGSTLLDLVLGGGWVLGRIANLVGDKSTGKTLLAIEAAANFVRTFPEGKIRYCEAEAAFDVEYASELGLPVDKVEFASEIFTIEDLFEDVKNVIKESDKTPYLYILDSLDALSDKAEQDRKITDTSYGASKAKKLGELFRRMVKEMESKNISLLIISQVRDNISGYGAKQMRSGGHALDFYSSQIMWLKENKKIEKIVSKVERTVGVEIEAKNKKNKIGLPYRDCVFPIIFGYGVDDLLSMYEWMVKVKGSEFIKEKFPDLSLSDKTYKRTLASLRDEGGEKYKEVLSKFKDTVTREWRIIENSFLPKSKKYS
jgi:RecA/RadA recombinase